MVCRLKDREWIYPIVAGGSYLAAADCRLLLAGWESAEGEPDVEIHWPSGRIDRLGPLPQGRFLRARPLEHLLDSVLFYAGMAVPI